MNKDDGNSGKKNIDEGHVPSQRGYKPKSNPVGGHKPEKYELKPTNPPKKK